MKKLFVFTLLFVFARGALDTDWSLQKMCEAYGGSFTSRGTYDAAEGDKCKFVMDVATDSEESARSYCEEMIPYHIRKVKHGDETECHAEATLICDTDWIQLFGRCYKMTWSVWKQDNTVKKKRTQQSHSFIEKHCHYFKHVSRLWIDASEAITNDLIHNVAGGHLLLAIDGYNYNLPNLALARVKPSEKAMVLCEYTPRMTQAESNYLLERYGEIYYPTVRTSQGSYVRTASSLNRNENNNMADNEYCTKVMRPFIPNGKSQSAIPTREFIDKVKEVNKNNRGLIIRTSAFSKNAKKLEREKLSCSVLSAANFHIYFKDTNGDEISSTIDKSSWRNGEPREECDAASWSSAIVLSRDGEPGLESMSDARYAPIYCQSITENYKYEVCPDGFSPYYREGLRQMWCHKFFTDKKNYDEAEAFCQTKNSHVTGYTEPKELDFLDELMNNSSATFGPGQDTWLGAKRREECVRLGSEMTAGYETDPSHPCTREYVFEWVHGVGPNPPAIINDWIKTMEPNYYAGDEKCLTLLKGISHYWGDKPDGTKKLNDRSCAPEFYFFCGKEAPITKDS